MALLVGGFLAEAKGHLSGTLRLKLNLLAWLARHAKGPLQSFGEGLVSLVLGAGYLFYIYLDPLPILDVFYFDELALCAALDLLHDVANVHAL